jgi:hypothetical protein
MHPVLDAVFCHVYDAFGHNGITNDSLIAFYRDAVRLQVIRVVQPCHASPRPLLKDVDSLGVLCDSVHHDCPPSCLSSVYRYATTKTCSSQAVMGFIVENKNDPRGRTKPPGVKQLGVDVFILPSRTQTRKS